MSKPNLLLITRNLPPLIGGMERLLLHCAEILSEKYSLTIIGPQGCQKYLSAEINVIEISSSMPVFLLQAPLSCINAARKTKFQLIIGGSGLTAPSLWLLQTLLGVPATCFVHGLDIVADNRLYQWLFPPCLKKLKAIIANSNNTRSLCINAGIKAELTHIIYPGCKIPSLTIGLARDSFDLIHHTKNRLVILFVGRLIPRKGLLAFLEKGFSLLLKKHPSTTLAIIGDNPLDSLTHQGPEQKRIAKLVEDNNWSNNIIYLGQVDNETLSTCYAAADCLIFPLVNIPGDVEGFGMVAIEAAAHGTPTVAFNEGGVSDAIAEGKSGFLSPPGDYQHLTDNILKTNNIAPAGCIRHAENFSWENYSRQLLTIIEAQREE